MVVISDGRIIEKAAETVGMKSSRIREILNNAKLELKDVFIMTADSSGNYFIADKKGSHRNDKN